MVEVLDVADLIVVEIDAREFSLIMERSTTHLTLASKLMGFPLIGSKMVQSTMIKMLVVAI